MLSEKLITWKELLQSSADKLNTNNIKEAELTAWYLMEFCFGVNRAYYLLHREEPICFEKYEIYQELLEKRCQRVPLQYITGRQEFMGLEFLVNPSVLIPRQDTECLVERVMKEAEEKRILDVCTGSGCIIISLAKHCKLREAVGVDISIEALDVARKNAKKMNVSVKFFQSDLFSKVEKEYDIIVSNPPYIPSDKIETLELEVKQHEPRLALDGAEDGLCFYRKLAKEAGNYLTKKGKIYVEIGYNQAEAVSNLFYNSGYSQISIFQDLAGLDRVLMAEKKEK